MSKWMRALGAICALALLGGTALAEEMPVVTDEPLAADEIIAAEAERMRQVQQMLIDLGLLNGAADGAYGPRTAEALRLFQSRNGLIASGEVNEPTLVALREKSQAANEVREVQQRLIDLGYLSGTADGIFGDRSASALKVFQALAGLKATGAMDDDTRKALFADDARAVPAKLSSGTKGDEVVALQQRLIQLGFLSGKADGSYGRGTAAGVKRFQEHLLEQGVDGDLGITANGEASSATQALLFDPDYSCYIGDIAPGDEGGEVLRMERRLNSLGYMDADPDETFDDYAAAAAAAFREACGLGEGSVLDRAAQDALFAVDAASAEHFVPHDIASGDKGLAVRAVEEALFRGGMTIQTPGDRYGDGTIASVQRLHDYLSARGDEHAELFEDAGKLSVEAQTFITDTWLSKPETGDDEASLMRMQRRLHTLYYLAKAYVDGVDGAITTEALEAFQTTNGLPVTGRADIATCGMLFSDKAVPKQLPYRVEVSIEEQRVYVYQLNDAGEYELVQTFVCSTGLGNSTPRGIFLDGFPVNTWHHFQKFDCWAKYSFEIEGDIMFHSVLYSKKDDSTLREGSLYALGQKASHGCIRLKVKDARWLFTNCKRGTLVIVIH